MVSEILIIPPITTSLLLRRKLSPGFVDIPNIDVQGEIPFILVRDRETNKPC